MAYLTKGIARALYSRLPILIMDDIAAGLDTEIAAIMAHRIFGVAGFLKRYGITAVLATSTGNVER
jgi:ATP-binding cassette subfamily C (CFTR/MRP) protein 1